MDAFLKYHPTTYDEFCKMAATQVMATFTTSAFYWPQRLEATKTFKLASVRDGMTNSLFQLLAPEHSAYIFDQQNIRFAHPLEKWRDESTGHFIPTTVLRKKGTALVVGGMKNHWHFLINFLPRAVLAMELLGHRSVEVDTIITHELTDTQRSLLRQLFPDIAINEISGDPEVAYQYDCLFYLDLPKNVQFNVDVLKMARDRVVGLLDGNPLENCQKIFVDRNPAVRRRRLANRVRATEVLAEYRIEPVLCEEHSFLEQVAIFSSASFVGGVHGAGLANMLFCPEGIPVLIIDYKWPSEMFFLAQELGHRPLLLLAEPVEGSNDQARLRDLFVDAKQLDAALASMHLHMAQRSRYV